MAVSTSNSQFAIKSVQELFKHPESSRNQAARGGRDWQKGSSLKLRVFRLPQNSTTLDIHRNFKPYGHLTRIVIQESKEGGKSTNCDIEFEPVPVTDFWSRPVPFKTTRAGYEDSVYVRVELSTYQNRKYQIESPANKDIRYDERQEIPGERLDFGFLSDPSSMTTMASCGDTESRPKLIVNLTKTRRFLEITFPFTQIGRSGSRLRTFRFRVALDDAFKVWRMDGDKYILHLARPPRYFKLLEDQLELSHNEGSRMWSQEDAWYRQADISSHMRTYQGELSSSPVALPKYFNDINLFRWTTFRFHATSGSYGTPIITDMLNALRDVNVRVLDGNIFTITQSGLDLERKTWQLINGASNEANVSNWEHKLPQYRLQLAFSVRYQLEVCLSHGWLSEYSITTDFLERLAQWPERKARQALVYVATNQERIYDPMTLFDDVQYSRPMRAKRLPENCIEVHGATVTATGILFHTPNVEVTNRIIRQYRSQAHRFLRVRFEDDVSRGQTRLYSNQNGSMVNIFQRVKRALTRGIKMGNITYEFLAWGNSQLREHSVYFVAPTSSMTADQIRERMGTFNEQVVAKKAARMGQCFSTTIPIHLRLPLVDEDAVIPDIIRGRFNFSDGVGKISELAAQLVSQQLQIKGPTPCLFQFRLGGCKGVLAVSKDISGVGIQIRKSQLKFNSVIRELEIIRHSQFWQPFLNRQMILCLSHLKVSTDVFLRMQARAIDALENAMHDDGAAIHALRTNIDPNMMTLSLSELVEAGFRTSRDPFVTALIHLWRAWSLKYLKDKAKIPVEKGAFVLGCVDETATLEGHTSACPQGVRKLIETDPDYLEKLPEIFIQITDMRSGERRIIEGVCIIARNPSLHPGDFRVVRARNVPALNHMCDVLVMPQTGERDLPSMCSGGDLDGDDYVVIWDEELIPEIWNHEPFDYEAEAPKKSKAAITTTELINFFYDYMMHDTLGRIATAHLAAADALNQGLASETCLELTELHSKAVDYPKTGVPAEMPRRLERTEWPHFMQKEGKKLYKSRKVLGQLYDAVEKVSFKPNYDLQFDTRILSFPDPPEQVLEHLRNIKMDYDTSLHRICAQHGIETEFELWSTFVLNHSKASRDFKFHEEIGMLSKTLKDQYYESLCELAGGKDFEHLAPIAVAAYKVTYAELELAKEARSQAETLSDENRGKPVPMPFISFPWVLQETLCKIAQKAEALRSKCPTAVVRYEEIMGVSSQQNSNGDQDVSVELPDDTDAELTRGRPPQYHLVPFLLNSDTLSQDRSTDFVENPGQDMDLSTPVTPGTAGFANDRPDIDHHTEPALPKSDNCETNNSEGQVYSLPDQAHSVSNQHTELNTDVFGIVRSPPRQPDGARRLTSGNENDRSGYNQSNESHNHDEVVPGGALPELMTTATASTSYGSKSQVPPRSLDSSLTTLHVASSSQKEQTCHFWKQGSCRNTEEDCLFSHRDTGRDPIPNSGITCYYWHTQGRCTYSAESCSYAHFDTGFVALPPGVKTPRTRNISSKRRPMTSSRTSTPNERQNSGDRSQRIDQWSMSRKSKRVVDGRSDEEEVCTPKVTVSKVGSSISPSASRKLQHVSKIGILQSDQVLCPVDIRDSSVQWRTFSQEATTHVPGLINFSSPPENTVHGTIPQSCPHESSTPSHIKNQSVLQALTAMSPLQKPSSTSNFPCPSQPPLNDSPIKLISLSPPANIQLANGAVAEDPRVNGIASPTRTPNGTSNFEPKFSLPVPSPQPLFSQAGKSSIEAMVRDVKPGQGQNDSNRFTSTKMSDLVDDSMADQSNRDENEATVAPKHMYGDPLRMAKGAGIEIEELSDFE